VGAWDARVELRGVDGGAGGMDDVIAAEERGVGIGAGIEELEEVVFDGDIAMGEGFAEDGGAFEGEAGGGVEFGDEALKAGGHGSSPGYAWLDP